MNPEFFNSGLSALVLQGMLIDAKEGHDRDGEIALSISLLVSEDTIKNGVEMKNFQTHVLSVKNKELFPAFTAEVGQVISLPVAVWAQKDRSGFWVPRGSRPKRIKLEAQPPASVVPQCIKSPLDKAA